MAKEDEKKPTAAEKGKAKAVNGEAEKEVKKDKDGKPIEDKKGVLPAGMLPPRDRRHMQLSRANTDR
jgi:26S proteasome regulatory subunit N1